MANNKPQDNIKEHVKLLIIKLINLTNFDSYAMTGIPR